MNIENLSHGRFTLAVILLLALATAACGAAPDQATGAEDPPSATLAITAPPSTEAPADPAGTEAGPDAQPVADETVEPSLPANGGASDRSPGGGHPDQPPREK